MDLFAPRNKIIGFLYRNLAKKIFFAIDPETIHDQTLLLGSFLGNNLLTKALTSLFFNYQNPLLQQKILGIDFRNPVGLAAGFDKNGIITRIIPNVGFGFMEIGSVTAEPYAGNDTTKLTRLIKSRSLVVNYGLKNKGAEEISKRLKKENFKIPTGISIAKTNSSKTVDIRAGIADYVKGCEKFIDIGDYFTINISCPNSFGGEPFTDPAKLDKLLAKIDKLKIKKPLFVKFSPDSPKKEIDELLSVIEKHSVQGIICSNLTKQRVFEKIKDDFVPEKGGLSGKIVEDLATEEVRYVYKKTRSKYVIIGCGGIFSAEDAYKKIKAGASLIQMITGMIFEGPQIVGEINRGLAELLLKDGYENISQAVGADNK